MKPIKIEQTKEDKFMVFTMKEDRFLGWIIKYHHTQWNAKPCNGWASTMFSSKNKAERYLIKTI